MLRNREFRVFFGLSCLFGILAAGMGWALFSIQVASLILLVSALLTGGSVVFTVWRYREISKLSGYLRQISSGDYKLDVRDNSEGELSVLKSDIYKVTLMLAEHGSHLQQDRLKLTDAISDISHQLKTPLTSMMMMADLLSDANLSEPKREEFTRNIQVQLERIEWLVSSLLKLSKIDAGTAQFKREHVKVAYLLHKVVEPMLIPIEIKQQTLSVSGDEATSFQGDMKWTTEALINILKNCVEHTGEGGTIAISYSENPLYTAISISDNGKGISKKDLPYIFKRFYKGENAGEDSVGIGLAMAYSIVKSQNGDIEVKSEERKGTTFTVKFYKQVV
ncbi:sensor histidine kinase [Bacillus sp. EB01]|uniref:sensor histidine kinase n=1 Tax=Bacillus sp. EB01 TaxID=1347086 RepID=UPI0005C49D91|nr:HAMP domain-containing sensor histidine kinase [Bacillus sp. EB01]